MKKIKDPMEYIQKIESIPNIAEIVTKCGVKVSNADFTLAPNAHEVIALYIIENQYAGISKSFCIYIQERMPISFRRFLTAYLFCYMRLYGDLEPCKALYLDSMYDEKAYQEAIDLLIPDHLLERDLEHQLDDERILVDKYQVSREVLIRKKDKLRKKKVKKL